MSIELNPNLSPKVKQYFLAIMSDDPVVVDDILNAPPLTYLECYEAQRETCRLIQLNILAFATLKVMIADYDYSTQPDSRTFGMVIDYPTPYVREVIQALFDESVFKDIFTITDVDASSENPPQLHVEFLFDRDNSDLGHLVAFMQHSLEHPFFVDDRDGEEYDIEMSVNYRASQYDQMQQNDVSHP